LNNTYELFIKRMEEGKYKPREYIMDNLTVDKCAMRFKNLFL
jgi:hypothetical protein